MTESAQPVQVAKPKKPLWKRWWFWVIVVIVIAGLTNDNDSNNLSTTNTSGTVSKTEPSASTSTNSQSNSSNNAANQNKTQQAQQTSQPAPEQHKEEKPDLELIEHHVESDSFARYVVGQIKNNTDREYSYVQVEINLYDASGAQVGSTLDNTNNLEPGGVWKFKAVILEDNAKSYKIKDVSGF